MNQPLRRTDAFSALSMPEVYQEALVPAMFEPWAGVLLRAVKIQPGDRVLDVAAGTGVVSARAAQETGPSGHVTVTDISAPMLEQARRHSAGSPAPMEFIECSALALAVPDASQDVVLCQHGLQFMPDREQAAREMYRVLRPGGRVAVSLWASEYPLGFFGVIRDVLVGLTDEPYPGAFDNTSYAFPAEDVRALLESAGFSEVEVRLERVVARWDSEDSAMRATAGTSLGLTVHSLPEEQRAQALSGIVAALHRDADGSVWCDTHAHVATGVRPST